MTVSVSKTCIYNLVSCTLYNEGLICPLWLSGLSPVKELIYSKVTEGLRLYSRTHICEMDKCNRKGLWHLPLTVTQGWKLAT
jgi:hypothetical protein